MGAQKESQRSGLSGAIMCKCRVDPIQKAAHDVLFMQAYLFKTTVFRPPPYRPSAPPFPSP